jgi:hypothetical protein
VEKSEKLEKLEKKPNDLARLNVQVPNPVTTGKEAEVQFFIENMSDNPVDGHLIISGPSWTQPLNIEKINVGARSRNLVKWKLKVPRNVQPGKYNLTIELAGAAFDQPISLRTTEMVEVRP